MDNDLEEKKSLRLGFGTFLLPDSKITAVEFAHQHVDIPALWNLDNSGLLAVSFLNKMSVIIAQWW